MSDSFFPRGGVWVLWQAILMTTVIVLAFCFRGSIPLPLARPVGIILLAIAAFLGLAGFLALRGNLTPFPKPRHGANLVQSGVYSLVRHPLYTAVILGALGWALAARSWPAALAAGALSAFFNVKAGIEERWLAQKFPEYKTYATRVKRFIPFLW